MAKRRYYRVILKNNKTNEIQVGFIPFTNRKEADIWGKAFCEECLDYSYEIKEF